MLPSNQTDEKIQIDIPFFVFAALLCFWGLSEYLYPPSRDFFERTVPKAVHALILFWSLVCILYDYRVHGLAIVFNRTMLWGFLLTVVLFTFPLFSYNRVEDDLILFLRSKFYSGCYITQWFFIMFFCTVHMQVNPKAYRTFLYFVPLMVLFFYMATIRHSNLNIEFKGDESNQSGIYAGYYLVCLYPFIWDLRNKILRYALLLLVIYGVIYSMKRGAMLCLLSSLFLSFLSYYLFFATGLKRIPYFYAMIVVFSIMVLAVLYSINTKQETFNRRMKNIESGSGRIEIYGEALKRFAKAPIMDKILGSREQRFCAHNDFLFILYNFGIIGFMFLVMFNLAWFRLALEVLQARLLTIPSFLVALGNGFLIEMISYGVEGHAFMLCCVYAGMIQGFMTSNTDGEQIEVIEEYIIDEWTPELRTDSASNAPPAKAANENRKQTARYPKEGINGER